MKNRHWKTLKSKYLLKRWWMNLREDHVRLPTGVELAEYHVLEYPNWACVLCLTEAGHVVMVEQYRHGIGEVILELPAGMIQPNELPLDAVQRELLEETGYEADAWHLLGPCAPEPSRHTNDAYCYVARNARKVGLPQLDAGEDLRVRLVPAAELLQMADAGQIRHGIHIATIFWAVYRRWLKV